MTTINLKQDNRTWNDLSEEEKDLWDDVALRNPRSVLLWRIILQDKRCPMCRYKVGLKGPRSWSDFQFHMSSTHGIDPENLANIMRGKPDVKTS